MGEVVNLTKEQPHVAAKAVCLACRHEFLAVAATGTQYLTCPNCDLERATWKFPLSPPGREMWFCGCGGELFTLTRAQPHCATCGKASGWPNG